MNLHVNSLRFKLKKPRQPTLATRLVDFQKRRTGFFTAP